MLSAGFVDVRIEQKPSSKEYIKDWMPGAGAEEYIVSADVTAVKPMEAASPVVQKVAAPAASC